MILKLVRNVTVCLALATLLASCGVKGDPEIPAARTLN